MSFNPAQLRDAERHVLTATVRGDIADFTDGQWPQSPKPAVRAVFLRHLLLGLPVTGVTGGADWTVRLPGVRVKGALIEGELDLKDCAGKGADGLPAIELLECDIPKVIDISHARLARFAISGSAFTFLRARDARFQGPFEFKGVKPHPIKEGHPIAYIDASGASIDGDINGLDAHLVAPQSRPAEARAPGQSAYALRLAEAQVRGNVNLSRLIADGGVSLSTARIAGEIWARGAQLTAGESYAFNGRAARVGGAVMLIGGFVAKGNVSFAGAQIGAAFAVSRDMFAASTKPGQIPAGANVEGRLDLREARIEGSVDLGGVFSNPEAWAILALGAHIGGDLVLTPARDGAQGALTQIIGGASFERAKIAGKVVWDGLQLSGKGPDDPGYRAVRKRFNCAPPILNFSDATIGSSIKARHLMPAPGTDRLGVLIDLTGASCAALDDSLPPTGKGGDGQHSGWGDARTYLKLEGFVYGRLEPDEGATPANSKSDRWSRRKKWLTEHYHKYNDFHPQPYAQLASFYEATGWHGDMAGARKNAQWRQLRNDLKLWRRFGLQFLMSAGYGLIAGFGFAPIRLAIILAVYLYLGGLMFESTNVRGRLVREVELTQTEADQIVRSSKAGAPIALSDGLAPRCDDAINPWVYALDVAIPLLDFRQESQCEIGAAPPKDAKLSPAQPRDVFIWRIYKALYALFGAILTALSVITFTGLLRRKLER